MRQSKELQVGKAGEYLVCADLILKGFVAFPSEQGLPYDVLLDNGNRIIKIQVKTTSAPRVIPQRRKETKCYIFNIKRHGKNNQVRYDPGDTDVFALVCLDTRQIGYIKNSEMPETINIRPDALRGSYRDEKGMSDCSNAIKLKNKGLTQLQISKELKIDIAKVSKYLQNGYSPFITNARYFSDFEKEPEWIAQL